MKKSTEKNAAETTAKFVIPETYWHKFVVGNKVANLMHGDGQETIDCLTTIEDGLCEACKDEDDPKIRRAFEYSLGKVHEALAAYRDAFYSLRKEGF